MSLILDALKKLDREKDARDPGVVVVGSVPWGARQPSRRPLAVAGLTGLLLAVVAGAWWVLRPTPRATSPAPAVPPAALPTTVAPASPIAPVPAPAQPRTASPLPVAARDAVPPERPPVLAPAPAAPPASATADPAEDVPVEAAAPATGGARSPDELVLQAISEREGRPVALVNDRLVREGDSFDGVTVVRIGASEVEVEVRGRRRVLRF
jgi:hypothetical protein